MSRGIKRGDRKADKAKTGTTAERLAPANLQTLSSANLTISKGSGNSPDVQQPHAASPQPGTTCHSRKERKSQQRPGPSLTANAIGSGVLAILLLLSWASPGLLPHAYIAFACIGLPWRCISFARRRYTFFLADFCYFANILVVLFLLLDPGPTADSDTGGKQGPLRNSGSQQPRSLFSAPWPGLHASVYVLAEGPLAAAILAWRCAWVVGSLDHTISVLIHLLPGLAMTAHRYAWQSHTHLPIEACSGIQHLQSATAMTAQSNQLADLDAFNMSTHWHECHQHGCESASWLQAQQLAYICRQPRLQQAQITQQWLLHSERLLRAWCAAPGLQAGSAHTTKATLIQRMVDHGQQQLAAVQRHVQQAAWQASPLSGPLEYCLWLGAVPLAMYLLWQLTYFLTVQVAFRDFIRCHGYDTSYNALARRSAKAGGGAVSAFVRRGSIARRVVAYGVVQLAFTLCSMVVGMVTYTYQPAAILWQTMKVALPLYWGLLDTVKRQAQARWE